MRAANAPGDGGDIGTDMNKMLIERKIDQESAKREMKVGHRWKGVWKLAGWWVGGGK